MSDGYAVKLLRLESGTPEPVILAYLSLARTADNPRAIPRYPIRDPGPDNGTQIYLRTTRLRL